MIKLLIIIYVLYKLTSLNIIGKIINIILPFILAFVLAYTFYPILKKLNKKIPKVLSILIIIIIIILIIVLTLSLVIPLIFKEGAYLINILLFYLNLIGSKYHLDLSSILNYLSNIQYYKYIISGLSISLSFITKIIICFISFIYFLLDMNKIEDYIKKMTNKKLYHYLYNIDKELRSYINSLVKISIISFFEYSLGFILIGHDNYILMGLVAGVSNLIPYVGGIVVLIIGILLSPDIIIKICILYLILGFIDSYIINSYVYGKYNSIHPVISLLSMTVLGSIFGVKGIIASLPLTIIIIVSIKYFKEDLLKLFKM